MTDTSPAEPKSSDEIPKSTDKTKTPPRRKLIEQAPGEVGGKDGPEPTRHGDWAHKGIVSDF